MENDNNDDNDNRKPTIEFSEGFLDGWFGTDAELDQMIDEIIRIAESTGLDHVVIKSSASTGLYTGISIDDYAQELSADYVPKK
jgi:hypothetical protein